MVEEVPDLENTFDSTQQRTTTPPVPPTPTVGDPDADVDIDLDVRSAVNQYAEESARREAHSICLIGCGEAGSKLAGVFRLKPDFVSTYLAANYPVRAVVMDTQSDLPDKMNDLFSWRDPRVQLSFDPPPPAEFGRLLGMAPEGRTDLADEQQGSGYTVGRTGGAGGFTLLGRASAIYNILENEQGTDTIRDSLADGGVFNRENNGYLLTFSGLGGGTGSGIVPIVTEWMQRNLQPPPTTTFSLCVLPEGRGDVTSGAEWGEPRLLSNLLTSLYYLAQTPSVNGVMLADNLLMEELGHPDFIGREGINRYLQDVLMPLFLSAQTTYHFNPFGTQLDAANVRTTLSPKGDGMHEFIAAGFSIFPLRDAPERIKRMTGNIVKADPVDGMPTLSDMLHKALEATVVECQPNTSRNALALMAGPERYLRRVVKDNRERGRFEELLRGCLDSYSSSSGSARFFMASFPQMTDIRLTVLLGGPRFPQIEQGIRQALGDPGWAPRADESLADALRRLPEETILERGASALPGIRGIGRG